MLKEAIPHMSFEEYQRLEAVIGDSGWVNHHYIGFALHGRDIIDCYYSGTASYPHFLRHQTVKSQYCLQHCSQMVWRYCGLYNSILSEPLSNLTRDIDNSV
jgi:hypothetical protein